MDPDTGNTSRIAYEILDTTEDGRLFSIVRETGWIQAKESYAKLSGTELVLEVLAMDNFGNEPHFNDTAMVKVGVSVFVWPCVFPIFHQGPVSQSPIRLVQD